MWQSDYLHELTSYHFKTRGRNKVPLRLPRVGEVCLIQEPNLPRSMWKMGKIVELIKSADDKIRQVKLQLATAVRGDKRRNEVVYRSITHVYPLEIRSEGIDDN